MAAGVAEEEEEVAREEVAGLAAPAVEVGVRAKREVALSRHGERIRRPRVPMAPEAEEEEKVAAEESVVEVGSEGSVASRVASAAARAPSCGPAWARSSTASWTGATRRGFGCRPQRNRSQTALVDGTCFGSGG